MDKITSIYQIDGGQESGIEGAISPRDISSYYGNIASVVVEYFVFFPKQFAIFEK